MKRFLSASERAVQIAAALAWVPTAQRQVILDHLVLEIRRDVARLMRDA